MATKAPVWGIDVGQCSLKAMKLQAAGDQVQMLALDVVEHGTNLSQAGAEAVKLARESIEKFASRNDLRGSQVVVAVPGQPTLTRFSKMPPVDRKMIPDMVKYEASQQIPFDMNEVVWDYHVFTEADSPDVEVGIFAIRKELIRNHLAQFTDNGIEPVIVQAAPMASYNAVMYDRPPTDGKAMILLDMGALATDLIVVEGSTIWARPVPVGGNRFTEALVSAFKTSFKKAEELKRTAASNKYARQIFHAMRPVFADLVSEVQRSIGFYTSVRREAEIARILGMGNAFKLPGLQKFLAQNLQLEVEKLSGFNKLITVGLGDRPEYTDNVMSFAVAYGLALQGLGLAPVTSSLLPPEIRKTLLWRRKRLWFGASAACLAGAAASIWISNMNAAGALASGMGLVESSTVPQLRTVDEAHQKTGSALSGAPLEQVRNVIQIAEKFKSEYAKAAGQPFEQLNKLKEISHLPENNVFVPRIVDVIHRAIGGMIPPEARAARSSEEYLEFARKTPRPERDEIWVDNLWMAFMAGGLEFVFNPEGFNPMSVSKTSGWGVQLTCHSTRTTPAKWLDSPGAANALVQRLEILGREPKKGFYFQTVKLEQVTNGVAGAADAPDFVESPAAPIGIRGGDPRQEGARGGGPAGSTGFGSPESRQGASRLSDELRKYDYRESIDPLTGEPTASDSKFLMRIVVVRGDTPANLIPEQYKQKDEKAGDAATKPGEPAKPPATPGRRD